MMEKKDRPEVKGRNDAGNAPCPDCIVLVGQGYGECRKHMELTQ